MAKTTVKNFLQRVFYITPDQDEWLNKRSRPGFGKSDIVREALDEYIGKRQRLESRLPRGDGG